MEIFAVTSVCTMDLEREVKALERVGQMRPAARIRQDEVDRLKAEAAALKDTAMLEALHVWEMEKEKPKRKAPIPTGWLPGARAIRCEIST